MKKKVKKCWFKFENFRTRGKNKGWVSHKCDLPETHGGYHRCKCGERGPDCRPIPTKTKENEP